VLLTIQDATFLTLNLDIIADILPVEDSCLFLDHVKRFAVATLCCPRLMPGRNCFNIGVGIFKSGWDMTSWKDENLSFGFFRCDVFSRKKVSREKAKKESEKNSKVPTEG
jgi:hypothetical protein